jgi:MerR family transcriptional regulator/heat shock protein HspR
MYRDSHQLSARTGGAPAAPPRATDALYVISVAARLVELHPTTLRKYERAGFLEPSRTPGRTRLYSHDDIRRLRQIKYLVDEREMNLAGVQMALDLTSLLGDLVDLLESAHDVETLRRRARPLVRQAFATLGAAD